MSDYGNLSVRTANALNNASIYNKEQFREAVKNSPYLVGRWRGLGEKSQLEAFEWAGIPLPRRLQKLKDGTSDRKYHTCPHCHRRIDIAITKAHEQ